MRTATTLITVLLLAPTWLGAQAASPATTTPEVFTATAQAKNATGAVSGTLEALVSRYTPDFDRKVVEEALRLGGYPRFVTAIRNAPDVGQLVSVAASRTRSGMHARRARVAGGRSSWSPIGRYPLPRVRQGRCQAAGGLRSGPGPDSGGRYGTGKGTMAAAARVRPDGNGGVLLDDYAEQPIELANVTRKPA